MSKFVHVHSSGKVGRSRDSLRRAIKAYMTRDKADVITVTEVNEQNRELALKGWEGWAAQTGDINPRDDCGIMWRRDRFERVDGGTFTMTSFRYYTEDGRLTYPAAAVWVVLKVKGTDKKIIVSAAHMPPSVEGATGFSRVTTRRVAAWQSSVRGWRNFINAQAKKHETSGAMIVADWNVSIRHAWVRGVLKANLPTWKPVWVSFPSKGGTLGKIRIIDFTLTRGIIQRIGNPRLVPDDSSSDHRPYAETLELALDLA